MTRTGPTTQLDRPALARPAVPGPRATALTLVGSMVAMSLGEQVIGTLDQAEDVAAITAGSDRLAVGGLLLLLAAVLLGFAAAGLGRIVWPSIVGRIGWFLLMIAVPCGGAFAVFHLLLLETGAAGLDPVAMEQFIVERFKGPGTWGAPVGFFAIGGLTSLLLVLVALARLHIVSVAAPVLLLVGILMEATLGDGMSEIAGHWVVAAAMTVAAPGLWRLATDPARS